jgi:hypothetical protein
MSRNFLFLLLFALTGCGGLNGRSGKSLNSTDLVAGTGGGSAASIVSFYPAAGTYNAVPSTVVVGFSTSALDAADLSSVATFNVVCAGTAFAAQSVSYVAGSSSASVQLPSITGLAEGTLCTFSVSISARDALGNFLAGEHTANYVISSSGSGTGSSGLWQESSSVSYTAAIGTASGSSFQGVGAAGMAMAGLLLNGSQYVDGVSGLWATGFSSTSYSAGPVQGSNATFTQLNCPVGYRMTGIYGRAGAYIDSIGIVCMTEDQTQTYTSPTFGGTGGVDYTLSCPAGQFVTDLDGSSGSYLDQLYLGCR